MVKVKKIDGRKNNKGNGGKKEGAGRPKEYAEETKQTGFAVPISFVKEFRKYCRLFLDPLKIKK